ncbi:putative AC transposase [Zea mays]|uniref:Putative AC transposase n=1 Tax=Zea mays TaxID=4577 RepID=A0A3L6FA56_MAIZE|nr:putative AC transposase [Zea mays]
MYCFALLCRSVADASSSSSGVDRARRLRAPLRNGAGDRSSAVKVAMADDGDVNPLTGNDDLRVAGLVPNDEDDIQADAAALLGIDLTSALVDLSSTQGDGGGGPATATDTPVGSTSTDGGTGTSSVGKRKSSVWIDFVEIFEKVNGSNVRTAAICRMCKTRLSARCSAGTGHLLKHQKACRKKVDHAARVQSRLAFNPDGSLHNWEYDPIVARTELCRLIARLDLPLGIGETRAWEDYIGRAHNPRFTKVSRQTATRDLGELFTERRNVLINSVLHATSSVALTSDIWSGNAKEDYISVVCHYVSADWEL